MIAAAALLTAVVYVFTPLTAAGQEGSPTGFFTNTRYLVPGLVLALALLPIARPLRAPDRRAWQTLLFLTAVYAITVLTTPRWYPGYIVGTIFLTLALVWAPAALGLARARRRSAAALVAGAAAAVLLLAVVLGRAQEVQYADHHYTNADPFLQEGGPQKAYDFARKPARQADRDRRLERDLLRPVRLLRRRPRQPRPVHRRARARTAPTGCRPAAAQFRRRINAGDYDYLIISQYTQDSADAPLLVPDLRLGKNDPALKLVIEEPDITPQPDYVFKVNGKLDPAGCADVGK